MNLQELLYKVKTATTDIYMFLEVSVDDKFFILSMDNEQLQNEFDDIINQAFPLGGIDKVDFHIENVRHMGDNLVVLIVKCQLPPFYPVVEHFLHNVSERTYNVTQPEESAHKLAGCLFTIFNERQIEEFNTTWEAMYTNWKRFGVKKI